MSTSGPLPSDVPTAADEQALLGAALGRCGLTPEAFYLRYVALGGTATAAAVGSHMNGRGHLAPSQHDLAVLAVNERFLEMNFPDRLPYARRGPSE